METMEADTGALFSLLARYWRLGGAVRQVTFNARETSVAFGLSNGELAIAPIKDAESSEQRFRQAIDTGRITILPRRGQVPPLATVTVGAGATELVAFGEAAYLTGGRDGTLACVSEDASAALLATAPGAAIDAIAPLSGGRALVATADEICVYSPQDTPTSSLARIDSPVCAFAASHDGRLLAIAQPDRVVVRTSDIEARDIVALEMPNACSLSWSPDGRLLAACLESDGLALLNVEDGRSIKLSNYPAPPRSLVWSADAHCLVTSGGFRIVAWAIDDFVASQTPPEALRTGRPYRARVTAVDIDQRRSLVAAGYEDGAVVVAPLGKSDELLVKPPGDGAVRALHWSGDGEHLALGTDAGLAAIVTFPARLFK